MSTQERIPNHSNACVEGIFWDSRTILGECRAQQFPQRPRREQPRTITSCGWVPMLLATRKLLLRSAANCSSRLWRHTQFGDASCPRPWFWPVPHLTAANIAKRWRSCNAVRRSNIRKDSASQVHVTYARNWDSWASVFNARSWSYMVPLSSWRWKVWLHGFQIRLVNLTTCCGAKWSLSGPIGKMKTFCKYVERSAETIKSLFEIKWFIILYSNDGDLIMKLNFELKSSAC